MLDNLRLASPGVREVDAAGLMERLFPDGSVNLNTQVGEEGSDISGGERVRIGTWPAHLLRRPWLLLLDEPTAFLDPDSATHVVEVDLREAPDAITMVIATHEPDRFPGPLRWSRLPGRNTGSELQRVPRQGSRRRRGVTSGRA